METRKKVYVNKQFIWNTWKIIVIMNDVISNVNIQYAYKVITLSGGIINAKRLGGTNYAENEKY